MPHSRVLRSQRSSSRRKTSWGAGPKTGTAGLPVIIAASGVQLGALVAVPPTGGITLVRLRGEMLLRITTGSSLDDGFFGAVGVGIFTDAAVAVGATAVNTPIATEGWDGWLWHRYFNVFAGGVVGTGAATTDNQGGESMTLRLEVDSKAMRKLEVGNSLAVVLESTEQGGATMSWAFNSRTLVKLP